MNFIKTDLALDLEALGKSGLIPEVDFTPVRKSNRAAGYDVRACIDEPIIVKPKERVLIGTGVKIDIASAGYVDISDASVFGGLFARSSNKLTITNGVGVCDEDFQGEYKVSFRNDTNEEITINTGDRIAQIVLIPAIIVDLVEVDEFEFASERGEGAFGSTGL